MKIIINGAEREVADGMNVSAALVALGIHRFRSSVAGQPRSPLCGMGICFECRVTIDGHPHVRSCMLFCREGMVVQTDAAD